MINKQSLWFLTLFSLILVLSIYYITMPNEMFTTNNTSNEDTLLVSNEITSKVESTDLITTLKIELEDERQKQVASLEEVLNSSESLSEEKNDAYEQIKYLNNLKGQEEALEKKILKEFNLKAFVKIKNQDISIVLSGKGDIALANKVMRKVQEEFKEQMIISIKFEK